MNAHQMVEQAEQQIEQYLADLHTLVNIDSGTYTKAGIDRVGSYLQERFQAFGFSTHVDKQEDYGNHLIATHRGKVLVLAHLQASEREPPDLLDGKQFIVRHARTCGESATRITKPLKRCRHAASPFV